MTFCTLWKNLSGSGHQEMDFFSSKQVLRDQSRTSGGRRISENSFSSEDLDLNSGERGHVVSGRQCFIFLPEGLLHTVRHAELVSFLLVWKRNWGYSSAVEMCLLALAFWLLQGKPKCLLCTNYSGFPCNREEPYFFIRALVHTVLKGSMFGSGMLHSGFGLLRTLGTHSVQAYAFEYCVNLL